MAKKKKRKQPVPSNPWDGFALVRIRHPDKPNLFYNAADNGNGTWVTVGYSIWNMVEWQEIYRKSYEEGDGRNWDFFGEVIEVWPKGYSPE